MTEDFHDVRDRLRVAIESRWEAQKQLLGDFPSSHEARDFEIAFRYIGEHLIVFYETRDEESQTTYIVTNSDLQNWDFSFEDLWSEVVTNTHTPSFIANSAEGLSIWQAEENDGNAACAMLQDKVCKDFESRIYLPTSPKQLTVFPAEAMDRSLLFELVRNEEIVFPPFLLRHDGSFEKVSDYPLDTKFGAWLAREQHKYYRRIYNEQRTIFTSKHMDFFTAPYEIHEDSEGHLFSSITIFEGLATLWLPVVDQVKLRKSSQRFDQPIQEIDAPDDDLLTLSWDDFVSNFKGALESVDYYPHRYKFSGFVEADVEPFLGKISERHFCACRGVTAEVEEFGFPCLVENQIAKTPELKIRYVPTRVAYREILDDDGIPLALSDDIPSGTVGRHICVFLEYLDPKSGAYKIVTNEMIERWKISFDALARSVNDKAPSVSYTDAFHDDNGIVWLTEGGEDHNITSLLKQPSFSVNGDLVMWPVTEKDVYAFGSRTDFMNSKIPEIINKSSSFPPFPLRWDEDKEEYSLWLPNHSKLMYDWIIGLQNQYFKRCYDEEYELDRVKPFATTRCELHTAKDGSTFLSTSMAADAGHFHFPQVDRVDIWNSFDSQKPNKLVAQFSWDDFMDLFGPDVSTIAGSYPILGLYSGNMPEELLQNSALAEYKNNVLECICCH